MTGIGNSETTTRAPTTPQPSNPNCLSRNTESPAKGRAEGGTNGRIDGWMDGKNGRMDEWMDEGTNGSNRKKAQKQSRKADCNQIVECEKRRIKKKPLENV